MKIIENILTEVFNSIVEGVKVVITTKTMKYQPILVPVKQRRNLRKR